MRSLQRIPRRFRPCFGNKLAETAKEWQNVKDQLSRPIHRGSCNDLPFVLSDACLSAPGKLPTRSFREQALGARRGSSAERRESFVSSLAVNSAGKPLTMDSARASLASDRNLMSFVQKVRDSLVKETGMTEMRQEDTETGGIVIPSLTHKCTIKRLNEGLRRRPVKPVIAQEVTRMDTGERESPRVDTEDERLGNSREYRVPRVSKPPRLLAGCDRAPAGSANGKAKTKVPISIAEKLHLGQNSRVSDKIGNRTTSVEVRSGCK